MFFTATGIHQRLYKHAKQEEKEEEYGKKKKKKKNNNNNNNKRRMMEWDKISSTLFMSSYYCIPRNYQSAWVEKGKSVDKIMIQRMVIPVSGRGHISILPVAPPSTMFLIWIALFRFASWLWKL